VNVIAGGAVVVSGIAVELSSGTERTARCAGDEADEREVVLFGFETGGKWSLDAGRGSG
jgi:hypothetical protein